MLAMKTMWIYKIWIYGAKMNTWERNGDTHSVQQLYRDLSLICLTVFLSYYNLESALTENASISATSLSAKTRHIPLLYEDTMNPVDRLLSARLPASMLLACVYVYGYGRVSEWVGGLVGGGDNGQCKVWQKGMYTKPVLHMQYTLPIKT